MYAEIPQEVLADYNNHIQEGHVYEIRRFRVANAKSFYNAVDGRFMIYFTVHTQIVNPTNPPTTYPRYTYSLTPFEELPMVVGNVQKFVDVLGVIVEISGVEMVQPPNGHAPAPTKKLILRDVNGLETPLTLWGQRAEQFSINGVYNNNDQRPVIVLFVGCLMKTFQGQDYLSGSSACGILILTSLMFQKQRNSTTDTLTSELKLDMVHLLLHNIGILIFPSLAMNTEQIQQVCYVEVTEDMMKKEQALSTAIVATPINSSAPRPLTKDIYLAVQKEFPASAQPTKIESFPPDFILYFPTPHAQQTILSRGVIQGPSFILRLSPWTNEYTCQKIPHNTLVTVNIQGIPPQAAVKSSLNTLLLPHCDVQGYNFNEDTGICTATTYAHDLAAIPTTRTLGLSYNHGQDLHSFPLKLHTSLYNEVNKETNTQCAEDTFKGTENTDASNNYDAELNEDPDAVREAFEELFKWEEEMNGIRHVRNKPVNFNTGFYDSSSDDSFDPNNYEDADSDREPQCWKHGH